MPAVWFAALGSYQHNPWLLHLLYKILLTDADGGGAVRRLLDTNAYPFGPRKPPRRVRATLYHYDFTRAPSPWAERIPNPPMLPRNCSMLGPWVGGAGCDRWWARQRVQEYIPPVDRKMLETQVVSAQGWPLGGAKSSYADDACRARRTKRPTDELWLLPMCESVLTVRRVGAPLRGFVGLRVPDRPGGAFVDGPLLVIIGVLAVPVLARLFGTRRHLAMMGNAIYFTFLFHCTLLFWRRYLQSAVRD